MAGSQADGDVGWRRMSKNPLLGLAMLDLFLLPEGSTVALSASDRRPTVTRVVMAMHRALLDAPIYTTPFDPQGTFPEFGELDDA